jgi:hypothetical protein
MLTSSLLTPLTELAGVRGRGAEAEAKAHALHHPVVMCCVVYTALVISQWLMRRIVHIRTHHGRVETARQPPST